MWTTRSIAKSRRKRQSIPSGEIDATSGDKTIKQVEKDGFKARDTIPQYDAGRQESSESWRNMSYWHIAKMEIGEAPGALKGKLLRTLGKVENGLSDGWDFTKDKAGKAWDFTKEDGGGAWYFAKEKASDGWSFVKDKAGKAWKAPRRLRRVQKSTKRGLDTKPGTPPRKPPVRPGRNQKGERSVGRRQRCRVSWKGPRTQGKRPGGR